MKESDLAESFIKYLEKDSKKEIYQEVMTYGNLVDLVTKSEDKICGYELKISLNFDVIQQAYRNLKFYHKSFIVTPSRKKNDIYWFVRKILKDYNIGWYIQLKNGSFYLEFDPNENWNPKLPLLFEEQKSGEHKKAGTNHGKPFTPFKNTIKNVIEYCKTNNISNSKSIPLSEAVKNVEHHYASDASAVSSLKKYFISKENKEVQGQFYIYMMKQDNLIRANYSLMTEGAVFG